MDWLIQFAKEGITVKKYDLFDTGVLMQMQRMIDRPQFALAHI